MNSKQRKQGRQTQIPALGVRLGLAKCLEQPLQYLLIQCRICEQLFQEGLMLLFAILAILAFGQEKCEPFGFRLSLGHYFSYLEDRLDVLRLAFNTQDACPGQFKIVLRQPQFEATIDRVSTKLLNMTDLTLNDTNKYQYETYVHKVSFQSYDFNWNDSSEVSLETYEYTVQSSTASYGPFWFDLPLKHKDSEYRFVVFGDMDSNWTGNTSKPTFDWFEDHIKQQVHFDALLFMGDMAYNFQALNYQFGEQWLRNLSHITKSYPFVITPGNHDHGNNKRFEFLRANFDSLDLREYDSWNYYNEFYSFDMGYVHFIQYNPMFLVYEEEADKPYYRQTLLRIFENDLQLAQRNRENVPWIIVFNHYPMICSSTDEKCKKTFKNLREFEELFKKYKVDLFLTGHQHNYERDKPTFQNEIAAYEQEGNTITDYEMPVQIIEGAAGNDYQMPDAKDPYQDFTVCQEIGTGVGILTVANKSHLRFEHHLTNNDSIVDTIWIVKPKKKIDEEVKISSGELVLIILGVIVVVGIISFWVYYRMKRRKSQNLINVQIDEQA